MTGPQPERYRTFDVEYEAIDQKGGMTAHEAREAFAHAIEVVRVVITWRGKIKKVVVREDRWASGEPRRGS